MKRSFDNMIKITPIYIDIYSSDHLEKYLKQRQLEFQSIPLTNGSIKKESLDSSIPIVSPSTTGKYLSYFSIRLNENSFN